MHGEAGLRKRTDEWSDGEVPTIYPDGGLPRGAAPKFDGPPVAPELLPPPQGVPGDPGPTFQKNNTSSLEQPAVLPSETPRGILSPMAAQRACYPAAAQPAGVQPATYEQPIAPAAGYAPGGFMPGGFMPGGFVPQANPPASPPSPQGPWYHN
jgi:hypothetical protein